MPSTPQSEGHRRGHTQDQTTRPDIARSPPQPRPRKFDRTSQDDDRYLPELVTHQSRPASPTPDRRRALRQDTVRNSSTNLHSKMPHDSARETAFTSVTDLLVALSATS
jgi:hypothetical protein